jgi:hypothetical protein
MSYLTNCINLFGFTDISDITLNNLKRSFKTSIVKTHPDKGGKEDDFDNMLSAYMYLSEVVKRINGGRCNLEDITSPDKIKEMRNNFNEELNNLFCELEQDEFNIQFIKKHISNNKGYETWLKDNSNDVIKGKYGDVDVEIPVIAQNNIIKSDFNNEFNKLFETENKCTENKIVKIHFDDMALCSGKNIGYDILNNDIDNYTSDINETPGYTDLYSAYTSDNIITNKVQFNYNEKTFDEILEERNSNIKPLDDNELKEFHEYEAEKQRLHVKNITEYFNAACDVLIADDNDGFVINVLQGGY